MSEVDKPFEIPSHWRWHRLDQVGEIHSGSTPSTKEDDNFGGDIPWLTPGDLSEYDGKFVSRGERNLTQKGLESCSAKLLPKGAVLFSSRAPIGYTVIAQNPISTNQGFKNLVPGDEVDNEFAYHYLKGSTGLAKSYASGTTFSELSATRFAQIPIPLPPLPEQRRIVAKIEELFTNLDAGRSDLRAAEQQLERYRLSVLQAAVEGRLTADWRRTHDPEPADQLLQKAEAKETVNKYKNRGKLTEPDDSLMYEIPETWEWVQIGDLASAIRYGTSDKAKKENKGVPMLRMGDIEDGELHYDDLKYLPEDWEDKEKFLLRDGDILFNRTNSAKLVGKTAVYKDSHPEAVFASYLVRARLYLDVYVPDFMAYYINSVQGRKYINSVVSQQVGQANVNATKMASMPIPLPPFAEQKQIVDEIERLLSVADDAAATAEREQTRAERLRQSILKQAFSGQLVSHDEDASPPTVNDIASDTASQGDGDTEVEDLLGSADPDKQIEMDL